MTIRLLLSSFATWLRSEVTAMRVAIDGFNDRRTAIVDDYVSQRVLYVAALDSLTSDERARISPQIEAHVTLCARKKAVAQAIRDIISERRAFLWVIAGPFLALGFIPPLYGFLAAPNGPTAAFRIAILAVIMFLALRAHKTFALRSSYAKFVVACLFLICVISIKGAHSAWPAQVESVIQLPVSTGWQRWDSSVVRIDEVQSLEKITSLLTPVAVMVIVYGFGRLYLALLGKSIILGDEFHSVVVDELLRINHLLYSAENVATSTSSRLGPRDLNLTMYFKDEIVTQLQSLMRIFDGPWRRSMYIGDKVTDSQIDVIADGLVAATRNWMLRVRTQGVFASGDASEAFASALIDSVDGNWQAMAIDGIPSQARLKKRVTRFLRTMVAIAIIVGMIAFLKGGIPGVPEALEGGGLQFPVAVLATLLAAAVDPHASERISTATRLIGETSLGRKTE